MTQEIEFYKKLDSFSLNKIPFFFAINFEQNKFIFCTLDELKYSKNILIEFPNFNNNLLPNVENKTINLNPKKLDKQLFETQFLKIKSEIEKGNSYLTNLTFEIPLNSNVKLNEIFESSKAKYKLFIKNQFICFSPESFIKIINNKIFTFPMKGTIDSSIPNAKKILLNDEKETAEHFTIVDLLRNDLSQVSNNVKVNKFRYLENISTNNKKIIQASSEIQGNIKEKYKNKIGSILEKLLPAGSISGAPKKKTLEIILDTETHKRNFYTGISGVFDGKNLDTCVLIRFIEQKNNELIYKSGAGIHIKSNLEQEYQEILDKIYVPVF